MRRSGAGLRDARRDETGAAAILLVILTVVLIGCLAFVTDLGMAYANQRRLQNGADAAALAVGQKIAAGAGHTDACGTVASTYNSAATRALAETFLADNAGSSHLAAGTAGFEVTCENVSGTLTLVVKVSGQEDSPSFLGGVFGRDMIPLSKGARVIVGPAGTVIGLRPFAVCKVIADQVASTPGTTFTVPITNADTGCGSAAGNWAMLDFNGGSNPTDDMKKWIKVGYDGPVSDSPPVLIDGDPGFNVNAATDEMDAMMQESAIALPVFDSISGSGNGAKARIVGFLTATPCRYQIGSKSGPDPDKVQPGCGPLPGSVPSSYIQLKFASYIPMGQINKTCTLANTACDKGPRVFQLAE